MERLYVRDTDLNSIAEYSSLNDLAHATNLSFDTMIRRGYGGCRFQVRRDIAKYWAVKSAYDVIIRDGHEIVYQGILQAPQKALRGNESVITVEALGYYSLLAQRKLRKRWADSDPYSRFYWPSSRLQNGPQQRLNSTIRGNLCTMDLPGEAVTSSAGDGFWWEYQTVPSDVIVRVRFDYYMEAGASDTLQLITHNVDQATTEDTLSVTNSTATADAYDVDFSAGDTDTFQIRYHLSATDGDADGLIYTENCIVFCELSHTGGIPNYYADEIIKDILNLKVNGDISTDYDEIGTPNYALIPFATRGDTYETCDSIIQRACNYGDGSQNTWDFNIWSKDYKGASSDGLPKAELVQRAATTDYEYTVSLGELEDFTDEESLDGLYNWVIVKYDDADGNTTFIDPDEQATLKDQTSIDTYGQRDSDVLYIGKADSTVALEYGERYLNYHKDPIRKARFSLQGNIRKKGGVPVPTNRVRAGQRVKIEDYNDGEILVISQTNYNAENRMLRIEPGVPPDDVAIRMAQRDLVSGQ